MVTKFLKNWTYVSGILEEVWILRLETISCVRFLKAGAFNCSQQMVGKDFWDSLPEMRAADSHVQSLYFLKNKKGHIKVYGALSRRHSCWCPYRPYPMQKKQMLIRAKSEMSCSHSGVSMWLGVKLKSMLRNHTHCELTNHTPVEVISSGENLIETDQIRMSLETSPTTRG